MSKSFRNEMLKRAVPGPDDFNGTVICDAWSEGVTNRAVDFIPDHVANGHDVDHVVEHVSDVLNAFLVFLVLTYDTEWIIRQVERINAARPTTTIKHDTPGATQL